MGESIYNKKMISRKRIIGSFAYQAAPKKLPVGRARLCEGSVPAQFLSCLDSANAALDTRGGEKKKPFRTEGLFGILVEKWGLISRIIQFRINHSADGAE